MDNMEEQLLLFNELAPQAERKVRRRSKRKKKDEGQSGRRKFSVEQVKILEKYSKLEAEKEAIALDKGHLQAQVLKLEQQLSEAEKETRRLNEQSDGDGSLSSSSMATFHPLMGEDHHTVHQDEALLYVHENNFIPAMEWLSSYGFYGF
ncbi:hypothetical protein QJS10_CPB22g00843 [Acorus calamus]|uniref:Uncharacterized protein n=1 Tax=Acorus calamus TaxID=4465 RepID=A0AAV9BZI6_ACOCL|nr:hypothetical protein QJS10_CPB22g00843 [Acorus calamus]